MENKSKKLFILLGVVAVIVIIIIAAAYQGKKQAGNTDTTTNTNTNVPSEQTATETPVATSDYSKDLTPVEVATIKEAVVAAPGANPITKDNKVVTPEGKPVDTSARVMAADAPHQTGLLDKATLDDGLTKLSVSATGFTPKEFTTKAGAPTSFALTSADSSVHVLAFDDPSLAAIAILVGPGQTKAITFPAPTTPGEYTFRDDTPGAAAKGVVGKMIVK
jgi:uncharacterized cupredoxin-like copper-binding protein